jgi:hypothetical protein
MMMMMMMMMMMEMIQAVQRHVDCSCDMEVALNDKCPSLTDIF